MFAYLAMQVPFNKAMGYWVFLFVIFPLIKLWDIVLCGLEYLAMQVRFGGCAGRIGFSEDWENDDSHNFENEAGRVSMAICLHLSIMTALSSTYLGR